MFAQVSEEIRTRICLLILLLLLIIRKLLPSLFLATAGPRLPRTAPFHAANTWMLTGQVVSNTGLIGPLADGRGTTESSEVPMVAY